MNSSSEAQVRQVFGVPAVLTDGECSQLKADLVSLWIATYGGPPSDVEKDIEACRKFFDPVARGKTLRDRLASLNPVDSMVASRLVSYGEPLVLDAGDSTFLVGIEGRILLDLIESLHTPGDNLIFSTRDIGIAERRAMEIYRRWSLTRLSQVISLRSGRGSEVMQAIAVGIVLALMVNRSDSSARAIVQWDNATADAKDVDSAIYAGADSFARGIATSRRRRSTAEHRLKGGYALTEARRRLAQHIAVVPDFELKGARVYVPGEFRDYVIRFLARDLARRPSLDVTELTAAFDDLVREFRASSHVLAYRSMVFERPADTEELKNDLLSEFIDARKDSVKQ